MRSSTIVSVLFAVSALATPLLDRRVFVTKEVVVTVTDYVTAGTAQVQSISVTSTSTVVPVAAAQPQESASVPASDNYHHHHHQSASSPAQVVAPVPSSSSEPYVASPTTEQTMTTTFQPDVTPSTTEQTTTTMSQPDVAPPTTEQTTTTTSQPDVAPPTTQQTASTSQPYVAPPKTTTSPTPSPATTSTPTRVQSANSNLPTIFIPDLDTTSDIYKGLAVQHHNVHRQNHSVSDMAWNETLAGYAEQVANTCVYGHSVTPGGGGYGQNIVAGSSPGNISKIISNGWYNGEVSLFPTPYGKNSPNMTDFENWGHYTQVVWSETESVGCYTSTCFPAGKKAISCKPDGTSYLSGVQCSHGIKGEPLSIPAYFTVCNYYPAGNYVGDYSKVKQPGSMGTVSMLDEGVISGL